MTDSQQPASTEGDDFVAACRRVAAALRRNARAAPDAATQRLALERADELEATALRHERIAVGLNSVEAKVAEADRLRALAVELVESAKQQLQSLRIEMIDPEAATRQ